jgi:hypothetical protein
METRKLRDYLPPVLQKARELRALLDCAEQPEIDRLWEAAETVWREQFIDSAETEGLARWEKMLHLPPDGDAEARRRAILLRLREVLPFTWHTLDAAMEALCGKYKYEMTPDFSRYALLVRITLSAPMAAVRALLARWLPANISYDIEILYSTHSAIAGFRHRELAAFTHREIWEKGIIPPPPAGV